MITTILAGVGLGFVHLMIGNVVGKWGWKVWKEKKENFQSFILFPVSRFMNDLGEIQIIPGISGCDTEKGYTELMAFMWSGKLAWHLIVIPIYITFFAVWRAASLSAFIAGRISGVAGHPVAVLEKMTKNLKEKQFAKKLAKAKQLKLSPIDPMLDGYTRNDIEVQMEEQRRIIEKGTAEYEKLKKIHENTWSRG